MEGSLPIAEGSISSGWSLNQGEGMVHRKSALLRLVAVEEREVGKLRYADNFHEQVLLNALKT